MTNDRKRKPHNRDQELPRRKGESIESTVGTERGQGEKGREGNAPLPEEETYEREPQNQRPRSWREMND